MGTYWFMWCWRCELTPMLPLQTYLHALLPSCPVLPCNPANTSLQAHRCARRAEDGAR
jgi:hypothetical protein